MLRTTARLSASFLALLAGSLLPIAIVGSGAVSVSSAAAAGGPSTYVGVPYTRLTDTQTSGQTPLAGGETRTYTVAGVGGVPASGVAAVVLDVAATSSTIAGTATLQVFQAGTEKPNNATVRFNQQTVPISNTVIVEPDAAGRISIANSGGSTNFNVDIQGYFTEGANGGFKAARNTIVDSSNGVGFSGSLVNGSVKDVQVTGVDLPSEATAVFVNVASLNPGSNGHLTFSDRGQSPTYPRSINYSVGGSDTTGLIVDLDSTGGFAVKNVMGAGAVNLRIEVQGYFTPSTTNEGSFEALPQTYVLDTQYTTPVGAGQTLDMPIGGAHGLPTYGNEGVVLNLMARDYTATGGLKVFAGGGIEPAGTVVNFTADESASGVATTTVVPTGIDGVISIKNVSARPVNVRVALQGVFAGYRAVSAADEPSFVNDAMALGVPEPVARLAVWHKEMSETLPVAIERDTVVSPVDESDVTYSDEGTEEPGVVSAPTGVDVNSNPASEINGSGTTVDGTPIPSIGAADGTCKRASGYRLWETQEKRVVRSKVGVKLYTIWLSKRWCANRAAGLIGTVWAKQAADVTGWADTWIEDKGTDADHNTNSWMKADGVHQRSGHLTGRMRVMRYCAVAGLAFCYNTEWFQYVSSFWNGTRQSWTVGDTDW